MILLLFCNCTFNKHLNVYNNSNINEIDSIDIVEFNRYNDSSFIDKNIILDIVDPIEPRIKYGQEIGNDSITIITILNPKIKAELNGLAIMKITFDCIDSLHIEDIELRSLQLKDSKERIVFYYNIFENNKKNKDFDFYKNNLISSIKDFKFWIENKDKQYSLYFNKKIIVYFRVKVLQNEKT